MKNWEVLAGKLSATFNTLKEAKHFARKFEFAQIIDSFNIVRFISKNHRVFKL